MLGNKHQILTDRRYNTDKLTEITLNTVKNAVEESRDKSVQDSTKTLGLEIFFHIGIFDT